MRLYAVIPTHNRPAELAMLLDSIPPEVHVLVIDSASTPSITSEAGFKGDRFDRFLGRRIQVIRDEEQPPNLSRLWNIGLDWAAWLDDYGNDVMPEYATADYAVAVLNDDVVLPPGLLELLAAELDNHHVDIAFPGPRGEKCYVHQHKTQPPGLERRMTGWCFTVRGGSGLRADERLRWWCGDDDLERQAATQRGTVRVSLPGSMASGLVHRHPDQSTAASPELQEQTHRDMATFVKKWGFRPW